MVKIIKRELANFCAAMGGGPTSLPELKATLAKMAENLGESIGNKRRARRILVASLDDMAGMCDALLPKQGRGRPRLDQSATKRLAAMQIVTIHKLKKSLEPRVTDTAFCRWYLGFLGQPDDYNSRRRMRERLRRARALLPK